MLSRLSRSNVSMNSGRLGVGGMNNLISAPTNEVQLIVFTPIPSSGYFVLNFGVQTTGSIYSSDEASGVQSALEGCSIIGSGNVSVTGSFMSGFAVEFVGVKAGTDQPQMTVNTNTLVAPAITVNVSRFQTGIDDYAGLQEVQQLTLTGGANMGTFLINSTSFNWNESVANFESKIETALGKGVFISGADGGPWTITWDEYADQTTITVDDSGLLKTAATITVNVDMPGDESTQAEQTLTLRDSPTQGNFQYAASSLAYNAAASNIESILDMYGLAVSVSGSDGGPWTITWDNPGLQGALGFSNIDLAKSGTGHSVDVLTDGEAPVAGSPEIQTITLSDMPTGGTFTVYFGPYTVTLAYNVSAAVMEAAFYGGLVIDTTVSGSDGGPWTIQWNANGPQDILMIDGSYLVINTVISIETTVEGGT